MPRRPLTLLLSLFGLTHLPSGSSAAESTLEFNRDIRPILSDNCFNCHGADAASRKGGLRLDDRNAALKGGKSGAPAVVPGKPAESELLLRARSPHEDEVMPPPDKKERLKPADLAKLERWISEGADYQPHWAFIAPTAKTRPAAGLTGANNPIDSHVTARLAQSGLRPSPAADAATLCRRIHLDVTGLPPTPAEVETFVQSARRDRPAAVAALVDELLQRDSYGEKWARLWLDAARYSDSNGYEKDLPREQWAWRDWVIRAFNRDLPYDQFIIEQIAGDMLPNATQDQVIATGFLRNSMINEEGAIVPEQFRKEELFDRMDCIGKAVLGLTLQCAQCHTHKFDPISHDEYFGLFAFIDNTYEAQSWVYTPDQQKIIADLERTIVTLEDRLRGQRPAWREELAAWEQTVRAQELPWTTLQALELGSVSGLNHPTQEADGSILTLGNPTTRGEIYVIAQPDLKGVTGIRLEALPHRDLPHNGPGRSKYGTWAVSELIVTIQTPGTDTWHPVKLRHATADFSEPEAKLEEEWYSRSDKEKKRTRGPVAFLVDGSRETAWRADRGPGRRNQESVAVAQFECPLDYPAGTKIKIALHFDHGGSDRNIAPLAHCRLGLTTAPDPRVPAVDYAAVRAMAVPPAQRTPAQQRAIFTAWRQTLPEAKEVNDAVAAAWGSFPAASTTVLHLLERTPEEARTTHLLDRGVWDRAKHAVAPHTPAALHPLPAGARPDRLAFARWLADRRSPLTARVAVNRVWQAIFGTGLVETSEDFGTRAPVPEYQDVLDALAADFMARGWSQKHLVRTILSSATYQQSSYASPALLERDPRNQLLARGPRFRLDAEVVRDSALSIAGLLTAKVGGPSIFPPVPQSVLDYNYVKPDYWEPATGPERYRRALYVFRKRSMPDPVLSVLDAPNGDTACVRRPRSNTPLAALTTLNEPVFVEAAQGLALRILREGGSTDATRADFAYRLCTARPIKPDEQAAIGALLRDSRQRLAEGWLNPWEIATGEPGKPPVLPKGATPQDAAAWTIVARVLLNLDETLTKN
jgi:mono/diheme cytochrome c family protein